MKKHSVALDILLTIITGGLWNLWVIYRKTEDVNSLISDYEFKNLILLIIYTIITMGIYFVYFEYRMTKTLHEKAFGKRIVAVEILSCVLAFTIWPVVDAYHQFLLNTYIDKSKS